MGRRTMRLLAGLMGAIVLASAGASRAADDPPQLTAQEAADQKVVADVMQATNFEQIRQRLPDLQRVLDHAPPRYPMVEVLGGVTIVRDDGQDQASILALLVKAAADKRDTKVVRQVDTYPMAAFFLGTYANEMKQPEAAIGYLDKGLRIQPENSHLVSEKAAALFAEKRFADALALVDPWLRDNPLGGQQNRARLLRSKGLALTELGRLDDSEAAYRESLTLEPGHRGALGELDYIAKMRAGGQATAVGITTSAKARDEGRAAIPPAPRP